MKQRRAIVGAVLLAGLLSAGCETVPMSYSELKNAQDERARFARAGIPDKSPSQLREEAAGMRRTAQEAAFVPGHK